MNDPSSRREQLERIAKKAETGLSMSRLITSIAVNGIMAYACMVKGDEILSSAYGNFPPEIKMMTGAFSAAVFGLGAFFILNALFLLISALSLKYPEIGKTFIGRNALLISSLGKEAYQCIFALAIIVFGAAGTYALFDQGGFRGALVLPAIFGIVGIAVLVSGILRIRSTVRSWGREETVYTDHAQDNGSQDGGDRFPR
ncbi:MAG: hypothetical protein IJ737_06435 [Ruminococcus sp.]|nr:hypothetical protein [Ruminococcus sp.]